MFKRHKLEMIHFIVPLSTGRKLCYSMQGLDNCIQLYLTFPNKCLVIPENEIYRYHYHGIIVQPGHCKGECKPEDTRMIILASDRSFILHGSKTVNRLSSHCSNRKLNCFHSPGTGSDK